MHMPHKRGVCFTLPLPQLSMNTEGKTDLINCIWDSFTEICFRLRTPEKQTGTEAGRLPAHLRGGPGKSTL